MKNLAYSLSFIFAALLPVSVALSQPDDYAWTGISDRSRTVEAVIRPPEGYERVEAEPGTFAHWLRRLPLKQGRPAVLLYDGSEKANQDAHHAVIDIDVGEKNLQQCADAVIRLRAEYLYSKGDYEKIHFNFTSGHKAEFSKWAEGYRPKVRGNKVEWNKTSGRDYSYPSFRKYLDVVFTYAGSYSLSREMHGVSDVEEMRIGDVFIQGGFPGHAVMVVDMAVNAGGKKIFMLAQSYMPAQDIHVLKNPNDQALSPWYDIEFGEELHTPEWNFSGKDLKRF